MAFQNIVGAKLAQAAIGTAYAVIYRVPGGTRTYVKDIDICNTTGSPISIYVSLVASGGTASSANALFYGNSLPGNTTMQWTGCEIINPADTIQVKASASGCTVNISGGEAT